MNGGPLQHSCMKPNSFPRLLLLQHRLSLDLEILKVLPDFKIGYKKPAAPSPIELPLDLIMEEYSKESELPSPTKSATTSTFIYKEQVSSSFLLDSSIPSWLK